MKFRSNGFVVQPNLHRNRTETEPQNDQKSNWIEFKQRLSWINQIGIRFISIEWVQFIHWIWCSTETARKPHGNRTDDPTETQRI